MLDLGLAVPGEGLGGVSQLKRVEAHVTGEGLVTDLQGKAGGRLSGMQARRCDVALLQRAACLRLWALAHLHDRDGRRRRRLGHGGDVSSGLGLHAQAEVAARGDSPGGQESVSGASDGEGHCAFGLCV